MLLLTDHLGQDVLDARGRRIGRVQDLEASLSEPFPLVTGLVVGLGRRRTRRVDWSTVDTFERSEVTVSERAADVRSPDSRGLLLARDVLDHQVVDVAGKRVARVGDVELVREDSRLRIVAVDVGLASVARRLGLRRLARRVHVQAIAWEDVHLASGRGHSLQLTSPASAVHRLEAPDLMHLVGRLPVEKGAQVLTAVAPARAALALGASQPALAARLLSELSEAEAGEMLAQMPVDDAAAATRALDPERRERLLAGPAAERARAISELLAHEPGTAGAIMNPDVRTAFADEPLERVRARIASDPPRLEGLLTVVVVDSGRRPLGVIPVTALVAQAGGPVWVPPVAVDAPIDEVMARFATYDVLAVPVVDDEGVLVGAVAIDDVFDLVLAAHRPGATRFPVMGARRRAPA